MKPIICSGLAAIFLTATAALAATALSSKEFVAKAAYSDLFEVESGKLAAKKSANPQIKAFAQQMVADHT